MIPSQHSAISSPGHQIITLEEFGQWAKGGPLAGKLATA